MWVGAFGAQEGALLDPEAVLFVNSDELQVGKADRIFEQGMCADDDLNGAAGKPGADFFFLAGGSVADQQADLCRQAGTVFVGQDFEEVAIMLFGQDSRGGQNGSLRAGLGHHRCAQGRHNGLAGANIALQ